MPIGTVELLPSRSGADDGLRIRFENGGIVELLSVVDVSERLRAPRVVVIEGTPHDSFVLFGGSKFYTVTQRGKVQRETSLFREVQMAEYWTTEFVEYGRGLLLIYEAGVLALDENLHVRWHAKKFFNDAFVALEGDSLKFIQDGETPWRMRADLGSTIT
jgi:hypothetical protein